MNSFFNVVCQLDYLYTSLHSKSFSQFFFDTPKRFAIYLLKQVEMSCFCEYNNWLFVPYHMTTVLQLFRDRRTLIDNWRVFTTNVSRQSRCSEMCLSHFLFPFIFFYIFISNHSKFLRLFEYSHIIPFSIVRASVNENFFSLVSIALSEWQKAPWCICVRTKVYHFQSFYSSSNLVLFVTNLNFSFLQIFYAFDHIVCIFLHFPKSPLSIFHYLLKSPHLSNFFIFS